MALRNRFFNDDEDEDIEQPATLTRGRDTNRVKRKGLRTKFNPKREARRLREEPGRGNVEDIKELRNRPDPETDAFLGAAAREAGFQGDVGFSGKRRRRNFINDAAGDAGITFGDNPVRPAPEQRDQPFGVNPRDPSKDFGNTDFTARGAERRPSELRARSGKAALPGEMDGVTRDDIGGLNRRSSESTFTPSEAQASARGEDIVLGNVDEEQDRPTRRAPGAGFDVENSQVIASASPDSALSRGQGVRNLRSRNTGGTVNTIPAEAFVNPAFTGINSGKNISRAVRQDLARERRDAEIESDREFRRNLRERQLLDDANLQLSGNMSLTELADAAGRRRSARRTLQNRETLGTEEAIARSEARQSQLDREVDIFKEQGKTQREALKQQVKQEKDLTARQEKLFDRNLESIERSVTDEEGNVNTPAAQFTLGFMQESGLDPESNIGQGKLNKITQLGTLASNIMQASEGAIVPESLPELVGVIGAIDEGLVPDFIPILGSIFGQDSLRLLDDQGKIAESIALNREQMNPQIRRALEEIINEKVIRGDLVNARIKPLPGRLFQSPDDPDDLRRVGPSLRAR